MRVLLLGDYPDDPRLGSAKVYHKLREELSALGHDVDVLLSPALGERPRNGRLRWLVGPALALRAVARWVAENGAPDVIDAASAEGFLLGQRMRWGWLPGTALVARSHGLEHRNFARMVDDHRAGLVPKPWHRRVWYPAARMSQVAGAARVADRLLVLNGGDRDFAVRRGWKAAGEIDVVPHGVSARFLDAPLPSDAPRGRGILFCGSWDPVKGTPYLADAFTRLARTRDDARLTVLGPGLPEDAVLAAFPDDVRGRVTVVPRAGEDEVMRHYRTHDVLAVPSTFEGFGMVIVEAMSQRLPVVSTPVGCAPSVVRDGDTGRLVPPRDPRAMADALAALLDDGDARRRMGDAAAAAVRGMTWRATAEATVAAYARARASSARR